MHCSDTAACVATVFLAMKLHLHNASLVTVKLKQKSTFYLLFTRYEISHLRVHVLCSRVMCCFIERSGDYY